MYCTCVHTHSYILHYECMYKVCVLCVHVLPVCKPGTTSIQYVHVHKFTFTHTYMYKVGTSNGVQVLYMYVWYTVHYMYMCFENLFFFENLLFCFPGRAVTCIYGTCTLIHLLTCTTATRCAPYRYGYPYMWPHIHTYMSVLPNTTNILHTC